ncbi:MAG: hypothetical protein RL094_225 [Candidatus Parcubacteria bacterium]|jgi:hypothetical protein
MKNILSAGVLVAVMISMPMSLYAYTMGSSNYRIDSDSVNSGGTSFSTSTNYSLGDTVGELGTGFSSSTNYKLSAGFWTSEDVYISMNATGNVTLGPISGLTGGTATGSASYRVITNSGTGYQVLVSASTTPAMKSTNSSIDDYAPSSTTTPDFNFVILSTDARFGFSPEGPDIIAKYKDNGSVCNAGSGDTANVCWDGFSITPKVVAQAASSNEPSGATTTLKFRVQIGSNKIQDDANDYSANVTVTAVTL